MPLFWLQWLSNITLKLIQLIIKINDFNMDRELNTL